MIIEYRQINDLVTRRYRKGRGKKFFIEKQFTFVFSYSGKTYMVDVPVGFGTDFESIPSAVPRWIADPWDYPEEGAAHDYLYFTGRFPKYISDLVYRAALEYSGASYYQRQKRYLAVKMFGWKAWNKHRKRDGKKHN